MKIVTSPPALRPGDTSAHAHQLNIRGAGSGFGPTAVYAERNDGPIEFNVHGLQHVEGTNTLLVQRANSEGLPEGPALEIPVRASWVIKNDRNNMWLGVRLGSKEQALLNVAAGAQLALRQTRGRPGVTLVPVWTEKQVFPGRVGA
jgi:hypothetical protein